MKCLLNKSNLRSKILNFIEPEIKILTSMKRFPKSENTRSEILKFAEKRFARHGAQKTTIEEIARDVRMGKASLYHHFPSKEALYSETLRYSLSGLLGTIRQIFNNEETSFLIRFEQYLEIRVTFPEMYPLLHRLLMVKSSGTETPDENMVLREWIEAETDLLYLFFSAHQLTDVIPTREHITLLLMQLNARAAAIALFSGFVTPLQIKEAGLNDYKNFIGLRTP